MKAEETVDSQKELQRAKNTAYRLLAFRARSCKELETKLYEKKFNPAVICTVINDLIRLGYIDDEAFALQWSSSRLRLQGFGERRIRQELKQKGISADIISHASSAIFSSEVQFQTALRSARKKLNTLKIHDRESARRRVAAFLERKGFAYDTIAEVMRKIN